MTYPNRCFRQSRFDHIQDFMLIHCYWVLVLSFLTLWKWVILLMLHMNLLLGLNQSCIRNIHQQESWNSALKTVTGVCLLENVQSSWLSAMTCSYLKLLLVSVSGFPLQPVSRRGRKIFGWMNVWDLKTYRYCDHINLKVSFYYSKRAKPLFIPWHLPDNWRKSWKTCHDSSI